MVSMPPSRPPSLRLRLSAEGEVKPDPFAGFEKVFAAHFDR